MKNPHKLGHHCVSDNKGLLVFFQISWSIAIKMAEKERELKKVVENLATCLAARLGLNPSSSSGLDSGLLAALGKRLGVKGEVTMSGLLARMADFGLDLAHIEVA